jgi:hypothetical protein
VTPLDLLVEITLTRPDGSVVMRVAADARRLMNWDASTAPVVIGVGETLLGFKYIPEIVEAHRDGRS